MTHVRALKSGMITAFAILVMGGVVIGGLGLKECRADEPKPALSQAVADSPATETQSSKNSSEARGYDFLAIALAVGLGCLGAGMAVAKVGSAALGAIVEKPELMGRALIFVGLAEGIAIYGLIFGILLLRQL
jgi:V/A-type H+/Na+-transporting ATPase subunit K